MKEDSFSVGLGYDPTKSRNSLNLRMGTPAFEMGKNPVYFSKELHF